MRSGNILIALLVFLFSACTPKTTEEYLQEAALMEDQGQYQGAIIELKNALTTNPTNPKARMRLGKVYYLSGQFSNAEKELRNARDLGVAIDDYLPILVKSIFIKMILAGLFYLVMMWLA